MVVKSLKCLYRSPVLCDVTGWYLIFDDVTLTDILVTWSWYIYTGTCHAYLLISTPLLAMLNTWYLTMLHAILSHDIWHRYLPCYIWHMISDTDTYHAIFDTWYPTPVPAMLYLTLDTWHRYLPYYIWHMISDTGTCHTILDTWYMTPVLHSIFMIITVTETWHDYYIITRHLVLLYSWTPVLLNSFISCTHVPCTVTLINSTVRPASDRACLVSGWRECIPQSC